MERLVRKLVCVIIGGVVTSVNAAFACAQLPESFSGAITASTGADRIRAEADFRSPSWKGFHVTLTPGYHTDRSAPSAFGREQSFRATVYGRYGAGGAWLGARDFSGLSAGFWHGWRNTLFTISTQDRSMRVIGRGIAYHAVKVTDSVFTDTSGWQRYQRDALVADSGESSQLRRWSEMEARFDWFPWGVRGVRFSAALSSSRPRWGPRSDTTPVNRQLWGRLNVTMPVRSQFAVVASGGTESSIMDAMRPSRFFTLGMRWTPFARTRRPAESDGAAAAPEFAIARATAGAGTCTITMRAPHARSVEVTGDFTHWKPIALHESADGQWETTLTLAPGTYRMNTRVDGGAWTVPRGVPAMDDEFNGRVGIVVVR